MTALYPYSAEGSARTNLNDLIQPLANLSEQIARQDLERMRFGFAQAPVEGFGLVAEHIAGLFGFAATGFADSDRKWIVSVIGGSCHWQADHQRGFFVENAWRKH